MQKFKHYFRPTKLLDISWFPGWLQDPPRTCALVPYAEYRRCGWSSVGIWISRTHNIAQNGVIVHIRDFCQNVPMPIQLSYLGCSEKDHIIYRQIHFISCISLYLHTVLWRYQLFTPQGVLCPYGPYHGSIARAASRPNYRWTLRINTLHSRCSDDNRPVQFLAALSQSYPADYLHQCILQLIRLYRYDDLAQRAWCRKWFSFVPVSGVLSPDVRPEFGNPIIIYKTRFWQGLQVSTGRCTLDACHSHQCLPCGVLPIRRWIFAQAWKGVHCCHHCPCVYPCPGIPLYQHLRERANV